MFKFKQKKGVSVIDILCLKHPLAILLDMNT